MNAPSVSRYLTAGPELQHYQVFNECLIVRSAYKMSKVGQVSDMLTHRGMQNNRFTYKDNLEKCKSKAYQLLKYKQFLVRY